MWKPFLEIKPQEVQDCIQTNIAAAFSFSRGAILTLKENDIEPSNGKRGALIFTGAAASVRGHSIMSAFAAGKFGKRALSQSLAKEFGKDNIHIAHVRTFCLREFFLPISMVPYRQSSTEAFLPTALSRALPSGRQMRMFASTPKTLHR